MTATAQRYRATFNGVTFNAHYDNTGLVDDPAHVDTQLLDKITLERFEDVMVQVSDYRELRQYLEGADPGEVYEAVRIYRLRGRIFATTWGKLEDSKRALDAAFSPRACRQAFRLLDPKGVAPFDFRVATVTAPEYLDQRFYGRPATGRPIVIGQQGMGLALPYVAELVAFDTAIFAPTPSTLSMTMAGAGNTLTNAGNVYTLPKFTIILTGAGSNPVTLANTTTGQTMTFDLSGLAAGTYTLDCGKGTFTKADGTNVFSTRLSGYMSQMFLNPGANTLTWTGNTHLTSVTASWLDAWA